MRARRILPLLFVCAVTLTAHRATGQPVFHGNRQFSSGELQRYFGSAADTSRDAIASRFQALTDSLIVRDYLFARVDSYRVQTAARGRTRLHVYLTEGEPARADDVRWLGDSARAGNAAERAMIRHGGTFRWPAAESDVELLLTTFENSGYPFARVDVAKIAPDAASGRVDFGLDLQSGPLTMVDFVRFSGVQHTRPAYLLRESRLRTGKPYHQRRVDAARRRLRRLDFVRTVDAPDIVLDEQGRTGLRFPVTESRATRLDIAAGYLPETANRPALLTGLVNVEFLNLFGMGRRARLHWQHPDRRVQEVDVAYREPWILKQPVSLRFDFGQRIEDTLYVTRKLAARGEADPFSSVMVWGTLQLEAVVADSAATALLGLPDSRTTYVESGIAFDTRDHPTNPRGGALFSTFAGTGWRRRKAEIAAAAERGYRQQRAGVDAETVQEIFPFWIAAAGIHARALETDEPEALLPDLYRLGGARTLRGYREEQFVGSRTGWANLELRYWLGPASRVFLFADGGGVYREQFSGGERRESTLLRTAAGFGLRIETDLGVWGFDYGVGQEDRALNGKMHVSLLSSF